MTLLSYQLKILPLKKLITKTSKSYLSTMADVFILVQEKLILIQKHWGKPNNSQSIECNKNKSLLVVIKPKKR